METETEFTTLKEFVEKLQLKKEYHERMILIYMWIKNEHITKSMFMELIEAAQKMN